MKTEPPNPPREGFVRRDATRSHLVLEVASELVGRDEWPYRQARINLREQGGEIWNICLFGSDGPAVIDQVARGEVHYKRRHNESASGLFHLRLPRNVALILPSHSDQRFCLVP